MEPNGDSPAGNIGDSRETELTTSGGMSASAGRDGRLVVFFRHGIAEDGGPDTPDEERQLTPEGKKMMKAISRGLRLLLRRVDVIYSSPLVRALQTALWLSKRFGDAAALQTTEVLRPQADPEGMKNLIATIPHRRIVFVGHEPHLTRSIRMLLAAGEDVNIDLKKGGCCGIRVSSDGAATLEFFMTPRALRILAKAV